MTSFDISLHSDELAECVVYSEWIAEQRREEQLAIDWESFWSEIRAESDERDNIHLQMMESE